MHTQLLVTYHLRFPFSAIPPPSFSLDSILSSSFPLLVLFFLFLFSLSLSLLLLPLFFFFSFPAHFLRPLFFLFFLLFLESFPILRAFARTVILTLYYYTLRTLV